MDKLLRYINSLPDSGVSFSESVKTSIGYLRKAISVGQVLGAELCVSIEQATNGEVTRKDLRPDDWERIWPELSEKEGV